MEPTVKIACLHGFWTPECPHCGQFYKQVISGLEENLPLWEEPTTTDKEGEDGL